VALLGAAKVAVMAPMGSKSREVIYGGRIIGARIRAEGAREAAQKAVRGADRAAAELWSIQMEAYGGPAQPSPTIAQCLNGGYTAPVERSASGPWPPDGPGEPRRLITSQPVRGAMNPRIITGLINFDHVSVARTCHFAETWCCLKNQLSPRAFAKSAKQR
jgi:hypothetical protein